MTNFSYLFKFALRNITRNKARSFFIGFSVAISVSMSVWIMALFDGMNSQLVRSVVETNVGFFQVQEKNWGDAGDPTKPFPPTEDIKNKLAGIPGVEAVSPELVLEGFVNSTHGAEAVNLIGVDPVEMDRIVGINHKIKSGGQLLKDSTGAIIGEALRAKFHVNVGDQIVLNYQDVAGNLRNELLPIIGIYDMNAPSFQKKTIYTTTKVVGNLLGETPDAPLTGYHRYVILASQISDKKKFIFEKVVPEGAIVKAWNDINPEMGAVVQFNSGIVNFFLLVMGICISVTILTPISMLWQERVKEFEMMHTIGIDHKRMWMIGFCEAFIMFACSLTLSLVITISLVGVQAKTGIDFSGLYQDIGNVERAGIMLPKVVFPILNLKQLLIAIGFVFFTVFISYAFAIRGALKQIRFS